MQSSETGKNQKHSPDPTSDFTKSDLVAKPSSSSDELSDQELDSSPDKGFIPVLKNSNFLALWSGQVFSQLADKVYLVLMIALITSRFQDADQTISGWVSAVMIAFTIPAVLFGSLAGVYVDRWSKKDVLVLTNLLRGALVLLVPGLLSLTEGSTSLSNLPLGFYVLLVITFLVSTLTQFFAPAEQAVIPLIVKSQHLLSANSLYTTTMMASLIIGFAVGEPLLALADRLGAQLHFGVYLGKEVLVGGSYAIAGLVLLLLRTGENRAKSKAEQPHVWADIADGLRYVQHNRSVRNAMIQQVILFSVFAALAVLAVRLAENLPGITAAQFGFLLAAGGIGMGISAAILGNWFDDTSHVNLSLSGSVGMGVALVGLSLFTNNLWLALLMTMVLGGFGALVGIPMQTTIQAETPEEMRGKVFGLQNNAINIALSLPLALAGIAETWLGLQPVFLGLAALVFLGGFLNWYISGNRLNNLNKPHNIET
ncbi:MAG: MFS transporter [Moorea sp. SIO3I7]|nr:MFS transporter [Moorena sp. SIO3I7]